MGNLRINTTIFVIAYKFERLSVDGSEIARNVCVFKRKCTSGSKLMILLLQIMLKIVYTKYVGLETSSFFLSS